MKKCNKKKHQSYIELFKKILLYIKNIIFKYKDRVILWIILALPFIMMDLVTRILGINIGFYPLQSFAPNLFSFMWILLFVGLSLSFKKIIGKKIYLGCSIIFLIMFLVNNVYYSMTKTFFDFNLLESFGEGTPYILDTIINCNIVVYIVAIFVIYLINLGYKRIPYHTKSNYKDLIIVSVLFLGLHVIAPYTLGTANDELTWSTWSNPRNIYNSFNDNNKSMQIAGLFEYTFRNYYVTFLKTEAQENAEDIIFLDNAFANIEKKDNKYTGIFKDKNLIFVQLEGIDNWIITKDGTPTLYKMMKNGINFSNHYSYYNGGGSTFNSEFAVNTGFITPLSYTQNAYTFNKNSFPNSMANLFKNEDYIINAFHMNTGEYYARTANYRNWGYDNYYGLIDTKEYSDKSYQLDRELILNETFNELMFPTDKKFVNYIITYSTHMPFINTKGVCKLLDEIDHVSEEEYIPVEMSEEECIRRQAKETDYMMELLINNLEEKELLDNTIIVAFADHYLYTMEDKSILDKNKNTYENLINKTPFFIWGNDIDKKNVKEVTSQLNILPTILNLFGIEYNPNNYIGEDALNTKYDGIVFFSDYSWYDGNVYVQDGYVINKKKISPNKLEERNYYVNYVTRKNDLALKYNYFKKVKGTT